MATNIPTDESKNWKTALFSCCKNLPMCLFPLCLPCGIPFMQCFEAKVTDPNTSGCGQFTLACFCLCIGTALNRGGLRKNMQIEGNVCMDICCHLFCYHCSLSQEWREAMIFKHSDESRTICNYQRETTINNA